jgi:hypothetical protein
MESASIGPFVQTAKGFDMQRTILALTAALVFFSSSADARTRHRAPHDANGNQTYGAGVVVSKKTGATARVGAAYAPRFQAYIDDLEASGAVVRFMGGIRRGHCWSGGLHPCGKALDVCQLARGRVDGRCRLPGRDAVARIASAHGLFEGGQWCHSDYGHAQVGVSAAACSNTMSASRHRRIKSADNVKQGLDTQERWGQP